MFWSGGGVATTSDARSLLLILSQGSLLTGLGGQYELQGSKWLGIRQSCSSPADPGGQGFPKISSHSLVLWTSLYMYQLSRFEPFETSPVTSSGQWCGYSWLVAIEIAVAFDRTPGHEPFQAQSFQINSSLSCRKAGALQHLPAVVGKWHQGRQRRDEKQFRDQRPTSLLLLLWGLGVVFKINISYIFAVPKMDCFWPLCSVSLLFAWRFAELLTWPFRKDLQYLKIGIHITITYLQGNNTEVSSFTMWYNHHFLEVYVSCKYFI